MSEFSFGNIILANNGKKGILKPDANGYYLLNAGGFNIPNRTGITYTANQYIQECMGRDSDLNRRVSRGEVYAEAGHPPMYFLENINGQIVRKKITDLFQWILRLKTIDMDRACGHIAEIIFNTDNWSKSRGGPIHNYIRIKPYLSTVFGKMFEENLLTPEMNTSMSIRTVTTPQQFGDRSRNVEYFTNYDWVVEPGMDMANKHMTAGCEAFAPELAFDDHSQLTISEDDVIQIIETGLERVTQINSVAGVEAHDNIVEILNAIKQTKSNRKQKHTIVASTSLSIF